MSHSVYSESSQMDINPVQLPIRPDEVGVLMVQPEHYDVVYVINPHMEGMVGTVDKKKATKQFPSVPSNSNKNPNVGKYIFNKPPKGKNSLFLPCHESVGETSASISRKIKLKNQNQQLCCNLNKNNTNQTL